MKHLLSINDLSKSEAISILDTAQELSRVSDGPMKKLPTLRGRTIVNLFAEDSTRTRISFEAAAKRLQRLADSRWMSGAVINAGDGTHEHPSQALLDAFTIRKHLSKGASDLAGLRVAIVGDVLHSRVARSNVLLLSKLGARVVLVAPPTLLPVGVESWPCDISYDLDSIIAGVDAVMMLRIQLERMNELFFPNAREYSRYFGLNSDRIRALKRDAIVMHPGPMNRGLEITADAADGARSVIVEQVTNGVSIRMAILYLLLAGNQEIGVAQ